MEASDYFVIIISLFIGWISTAGQKTQFVRLIDVFVYGPFLIYVGTVIYQRKSEGSKFNNLFVKNMLFLMGGTTIAYNLKNYIAESQQNTSKKLI